MDTGVLLFIGFVAGFVVAWWERSRDERVAVASAALKWPPTVLSLAEVGPRGLTHSERELLGTIAQDLGRAAKSLQEVTGRIDHDSSSYSMGAIHRESPTTPLEETLHDALRAIDRARVTLAG